MGRVKDWAGQIREDERRMEDDRQYGYTSYLEAMHRIEQQRQQKQKLKNK